jgi:uncharacterized membrane protein
MFQPFIQEAITIAQYQDLLEKRDEEVGALKLELERLQTELQNVRKRNSKLCNILAQGESEYFFIIPSLRSLVLYC